jgi:hypothetical protein
MRSTITFVGHSHHDMTLHIVLRDLGGRVVRENGQGQLDAGNVGGGVVDQEVDVLREAAGSMGHDREPADQQVPRTRVVQRPTDADDVVGLRRTCSAVIILAIQASASSNEENR